MTQLYDDCCIYFCTYPSRGAGIGEEYPLCFRLVSIRPQTTPDFVPCSAPPPKLAWMSQLFSEGQLYAVGCMLLTVSPWTLGTIWKKIIFLTSQFVHLKCFPYNFFFIGTWRALHLFTLYPVFCVLCFLGGSGIMTI